MTGFRAHHRADSSAEPDRPIEVMLPVDRSGGLINGLLWNTPAACVGLVAWLIWSRIDFRPSGVSNGIVEVSLAIVASALTVAAAVLAFAAARWLLLALWPGRLGVHASEEALTFQLGPFGARHYDAARMQVLYPFEIDEEVEEGVYEALLPPEEQRARFIPRMLHPNQREPLHRVVLRFVRSDEPSLAKALAPVVERWRARRLAEPAS